MVLQLSNTKPLLILPWYGGGTTSTTTAALLTMPAFIAVSALAVMIGLSIMLLWWRRSAEATRVRNIKIVRQRSASPQVLPTPVPVMPRWLGFFGGHTLLVKPQKVKSYEVYFTCSCTQ